jgi:hypothetical protein
MPKVSDGKLAIGGLIALSIWIFVVLPFLYSVPSYDQSKDHSAQQAADSSGIQHKPKEPFWQRATDDPVAVFTLALVVFTFVLAVSTIGLWIVTWLGSRRQASDMEASIAAARDSASAAMSALGTERAWMIFHKIDHGTFENATVNNIPHQDGFMFHIQWKNAGRSPAIKAMLYYKFRVADPKEKPEIFQPDWSAIDIQVPIGQGVEVSTAFMPIFGADLGMFSEGSKKIIVYSAIKYFDIYMPDRSRLSEVCFEIFFDGFKTLPDNRRTINLQVHSAGNQNTAN